jgi:protein involved in polysaccharide export with SLBB domain
MTDHRSRWFQLSLKSLFVLVLVVAAFLGGYSLAKREEGAIAGADPSNIRRGDRLSLVFNAAQFTRPTQWTVQVLSDGCIRLPETGQVPAAGLSLDELTADLNARYSKHYTAQHSVRIDVDVFVSFENTSVDTTPPVR